MGQKKIKRSKTGIPAVDPNLEEVDEERAFEIEIDEDEKEVVLVHHYRRMWGDEMDADVEHCLNVQEAGEFIGALINAIDVIQKLTVAERDAQLVEKATILPEEKNPLKDNTVQ